MADDSKNILSYIKDDLYTYYNKFKYLLVFIDPIITIDTDFLEFLANEKIGGVIMCESEDNYRQTLIDNFAAIKNKKLINKIIVKKTFELTDNPLYYGFTMYFNNNISSDRVLNIIKILENTLYVFIVENNDTEFKNEILNKLENWTIDYKHNYIIGVNNNISKKEGIKNKNGLKYFDEESNKEFLLSSLLLKTSTFETPNSSASTAPVEIDIDKNDESLGLNVSTTTKGPIDIPLYSEYNEHIDDKPIILKQKKIPKLYINKPMEPEIPILPAIPIVSTPIVSSFTGNTPNIKRKSPKLYVNTEKKELSSKKDNNDDENIINEVVKNGLFFDVDNEKRKDIIIINIKIPELLKNFFNTLPIPTKPFIEFTEEYDMEFKIYLKLIVGKIINNEQILSIMTEGDNFLIWKKAFIHVTYDYYRNYEELEFIGDSALKNAFKMFLTKKFPNITVRALTEFTNQYLSTTSLCQLGIFLKLSKWLIHAELNLKDLNIKICEDLFEAFIGALLITADNFKKGLGTIFVYNFISELLSELSFDTKMIYGTNKTSLTQRAGLLGLQNPHDGFVMISTTHKNPHRNEVKVYINKSELERFKMVGFTIDNNDIDKIIGSSNQKSKKTAENIAWGQAIEFMEKKYNFTYPNCVLKSCLYKLSKHDKELVSKCLEKAINEYNLDYLEFESPTSSHGAYSVTTILYGFNGKEYDPIIQKRHKKILAVYTEVYVEVFGDNKPKYRIESNLQFNSEENVLKKFLNGK